MMKPLEGRVALVTGVSRKQGIGFGIAQRLAQAGANLFLHGYADFDRQQTWGADNHGMEGIIEDLQHDGVRIQSSNHNFRDPVTPYKIIEEAVGAFGHIDILVANHAHSEVGELEDLTADHIDEHLLVNVRGTLLLVQAFAQQHDGRAGGRVILMISGQHRTPMPNEIAYAASKGALHQITPTLATALIERNITVNAVDPGPTDTGWADQATYEAVLATQPMGRWGLPDDVARLVLWLVTDAGCWMTGQVLNSTGKP